MNRDREKLIDGIRDGIINPETFINKHLNDIDLITACIEANPLNIKYVPQNIRDKIEHNTHSINVPEFHIEKYDMPSNNRDTKHSKHSKRDKHSKYDDISFKDFDESDKHRDGFNVIDNIYNNHTNFRWNNNVMYQKNDDKVDIKNEFIPDSRQEFIPESRYRNDIRNDKRQEFIPDKRHDNLYDIRGYVTPDINIPNTDNVHDNVHNIHDNKIIHGSEKIIYPDNHSFDVRRHEHLSMDGEPSVIASVIECDKNISVLDRFPGYINRFPEITVAAIKATNIKLTEIDKGMFLNENVALEVVRRNPMDLEFLPEIMKSNIKIVTEAVKKNPKSFKFADPILKSNLQISKLALVDSDTSNFDNVTDIVKNDPIIMLPLITKNPDLITKLGPAPREDIRIGMMLAKLKPELLIHMTDEFRANELFMVTILDKYPLTLKYCGFGLKSNELIVSILIKRDPAVFEFSELKSDKPFIMRVIETDPAIIEFASESIRSDKDVMLKAVSMDGNILGFGTDKIRGDIDVAFKAIQNNPDAQIFVDETPKKNTSFLLEVYKLHPEILTAWEIPQKTIDIIKKIK